MIKPKGESIRDIQKVVKKYGQRLLLFCNVVGIGIGYKTQKNISTARPCIKVYVQKKIPKSRLPKKEIIPERLDNIETDVVEVGSIKAE